MLFSKWLNRWVLPAFPSPGERALFMWLVLILSWLSYHYFSIKWHCIFEISTTPLTLDETDKGFIKVFTWWGRIQREVKSQKILCCPSYCKTKRSSSPGKCIHLWQYISSTFGKKNIFDITAFYSNNWNYSEKLVSRCYIPQPESDEVHSAVIEKNEAAGTSHSSCFQLPGDLSSPFCTIWHFQIIFITRHDQNPPCPTK